MIKRNKKILYESIMRDVAKIVKRRLNESFDTDEFKDELCDFINDNRLFDNDEIKNALGYMDEDRVSLEVADDNITDELYSLIDEFAELHNLDNTWKEQYTDNIEELFYYFVDKFENEIW